jgi:hypothetical protein|tara:strand:+ start:584 stop:862 length:279 start_codon:yes stop_codon:yes gene_type:complete
MTETIENICYEYARDVLFSQEVTFDGVPALIIIYIEVRYLKELSGFLENYGYKLSSRKNEGANYSLVKFELINLSHYDQLDHKDSLEDFQEG